jgi:hypothetical protein
MGSGSFILIHLERQMVLRARDCDLLIKGKTVATIVDNTAAGHVAQNLNDRPWCQGCRRSRKRRRFCGPLESRSAVAEVADANNCGRGDDCPDEQIGLVYKTM